MRITVSISDELLEAARRRARERGQTLGQVLDAALRRELVAGDAHVDRPAIPVFRGGTGPRPGLDLACNRALLAALDDRLELDDRR